MYQFHFFDEHGHVPTLEFVACVDDGAATERGQERLGQQPLCRGVDIFHGERRVARLLHPWAKAMENGTFLRSAGSA